MAFTVNVAGQVAQIKLAQSKALWPLFETIVNSIQSLEDIEENHKCIGIKAIRSKNPQTHLDADGNTVEDPTHFEEFIVVDNGAGFNEANYGSFLESYSRLKVEKGCKGIGRFLWLKAFDDVEITSEYSEGDSWLRRQFMFTLQGVKPEDNVSVANDGQHMRQTAVRLRGFKERYRNSVAFSLESLARKIIEHCLPYFIMGDCPAIELTDSLGERISLNEYFEGKYKDSLHQDEIEIMGETYRLYHMLLPEGAERHELHLCAHHREVKSFDLSKRIPNMQRRLDIDGESCYYVGYLASAYLDGAVNAGRSEFEFFDCPIMGDDRPAGETEIVDTSVEFIKEYLKSDLENVAEEKKARIDRLVRSDKPQYRMLLNERPSVYDQIPTGLSDDRLDLELYKHQQRWEYDIARKGRDVRKRVKDSAVTDPGFDDLFDEYCRSVTELSRASLAEHVAKRRAVIDLLEEALSLDDDGKYSKESRVHSIICPMQVTSDDIPFDDMNLWLIDDRLAYHRFLASDKKISSIPIIKNTSPRRMDLAVFDAALSYTADPDNVSAITIVELKRPQRKDLDEDDKNPLQQVFDYVEAIKDGKVKKSNGRGFGNVQNVAFYCYVIADMTDSLNRAARYASLYPTDDHEGFFGYNQGVGAYVEVISYDKLLKNAKQRNKALFDALFEPKGVTLVHPEYV